MLLAMIESGEKPIIMYLLQPGPLIVIVVLILLWIYSPRQLM